MILDKVLILLLALVINLTLSATVLYIITPYFVKINIKKRNYLKLIMCSLLVIIVIMVSNMLVTKITDKLISNKVVNKKQ